MTVNDVPPPTASTGDRETVGEGELPLDDLFHVLQSERRRRVLRYLQANGSGPHEMRTVAECVAASEYDTTVRLLSSDQRKRVYVSLYQSHLPKLDDLGVIDYDSNRGHVRRSGAFEQVVDVLPTSDVEPDETGDETGVDGVDGGDRSSPSGTGEDDEEDGDRSLGTVPPPWRNGYVGATVMATVLVVGAAVAPSISGLYVATLVLGLFGGVTTGMVWWSRTGLAGDPGR